MDAAATLDWRGLLDADTRPPNFRCFSVETADPYRYLGGAGGGGGLSEPPGGRGARGWTLSEICESSIQFINITPAVFQAGSAKVLGLALCAGGCC